MASASEATGASEAIGASEYSRTGNAERAATAAYLQHRVREEADAAVRASSIEAMLVHISMATAYARRCSENSGRGAGWDAGAWADEHRVW